MKKAIYPGSFDPITNGHLDVLTRALEVFDEVIVLIAVNPDKKSRFSVEDRLQMIKEATLNMKGVSVDFTSGLTVEYAQEKGIKNIVRGLRNVTDFNYESNLSKVYRALDPSIVMCFFIAGENNISISSSGVDQLYKNNKDISPYVPDSVVKIYKKR